MKYLIVSGGEVKEGFLTWIVKNGGFDVILAADAGKKKIILFLNKYKKRLAFLLITR